MKTSALTHTRRCTSSSGVAEEIVGLCSSDLIAGGVKYHKSCYKLFLRISYQGESPPDEAGRHNEQGKAEELIHKAVYEICEDIIQHPRIVEVSTLREALINEATKQNINLTEATKKNLLRKILSQFDNLKSLTYNPNKVLIFPTTLQVEDLVVSNCEMHQELTSLKSLSANEIETDVIKAARLLNKEIKNCPSQMSWPPKPEELHPSKTQLYIPPLLDTFCTVLLSGKCPQNDCSKTERVLRLKNSFSQDMVFAVSNGANRTPKSVLFPSVVKSLCNNTEIIKLINGLGHGISYSLIEEIEIEYALKLIREQNHSRVIVPPKFQDEHTNSSVALMVADNIDNLENTLSGAGTSHRVNSILVMNKQSGDATDVQVDENGERRSKRKCKRSLSPDIVAKEIPEYISGKRVGPGELPNIQNLASKSSYDNKSEAQRKLYLIWIEIRKLKTHPTLLVPGWTGFNITVRQNTVVIQSTIGYLDTRFTRH